VEFGRFYDQRRCFCSSAHRTRGTLRDCSASNEAFSGWTKTFTDPRLCAAIVDRPSFAGQIIETGTPSPIGFAHARALRDHA